MNKHSKEIILENSSQHFSLKFWLNQMFLILEELNLEFRYDINTNVNYNSSTIIEPVQTIISFQLEFIYYLCIFSFKTNEFLPLIAYISIAEKFIKFVPFFTNRKILNFLTTILLFKIKILIENCNYLTAYENIKTVFKLCFRELHIYMDVDSDIHLNSLKNIKNKIMIIYCEVIKKIILAYFLCGVIFEQVGFLKHSIYTYKQCRWFSTVFLFDYSKDIYNIFEKLEKRYLLYKSIFKDIHYQFLFKDQVKKISKKRLFKKSINITYRNKNKKNRDIFNSSIKNKIKVKSEICRSSMRIKSPNNRQNLENLLKNIGHNLYKKEENSSCNVFSKYNRNAFVLSTIKIIDKLLSDKYNHILKNMKKVELTKQQEKINYLINFSTNIKTNIDFNNKLNEKDNSNNKKKEKNESCIQLNNISSFQSIRDLSNTVSVRNNDQKIIYNYSKKTKSLSVKNKKYIYNNSKKYNSFLSLSKDKQNKTTRHANCNDTKIIKYPLNKDVFSTSLKQRKNYINLFYEKEIKFQKKLLELKGYDIDKDINDYNQENAINLAEQEFNIINSYAESKNQKKNLVNLVKNKNNLNNLDMFLQKKKFNIINKRSKIAIIKRNLSPNNKTFSIDIYERSNAIKNNEEKSKMLNLECQKIEELQNENEKKRKILMNKRIKLNVKKKC